MKKLLLIALAAVVMAGCQQERPVTYCDGIHITEIDSCEYISNRTYYGYYIHTHKGNCRFCEARRKAEIREIINKLKNK